MSRKTKPLKKTSSREYHLKRTYGISLEQYETLLEAQGGVCWICRKPPTTKNLCVDHIHRPPFFIRGLLCSYCNKYLVGRHTDPILVRRIAEYLEQNTGLMCPPKKKKKKKRKKRHG